ncbi:MAG: hypothetical protein SFU25_07580 [Candidatus Caenarcaniphilales bacterium]|nr:hypothetical protein [Candidatus Caenarcaniphilales bacterium]
MNLNTINPQLANFNGISNPIESLIDYNEELIATSRSGNNYRDTFETVQNRVAQATTNFLQKVKEITEKMNTETDPNRKAQYQSVIDRGRQALNALRERAKEVIDQSYKNVTDSLTAQFQTNTDILGAINGKLSLQSMMAVMGY